MAIAARTTFLSQALLILSVQFLFQFGKCTSSLPADGAAKQPELELPNEHAISQGDVIKHTCELIYHEYLTAVENFTHCEIHHVTPFRMCLKCEEQFKKAETLYKDLNTNPDHKYCKTKYMMSDRVQVILTVQDNVDKIWRKSHCPRCYFRNGTIRERVTDYMTVYSQFNICVINTTEGDKTGNGSDVCFKCKSQYAALNANFNGIYDADMGDVCMDIMDMMNYTRINWVSTFNCTSSTHDSTPVIVISCFVACTPIIFYVYLRITGKVRQAKLFTPKRLASSSDGLSGSHSTPGSSLSTD